MTYIRSLFILSSFPHNLYSDKRAGAFHGKEINDYLDIQRHTASLSTDLESEKQDQQL